MKKNFVLITLLLSLALHLAARPATRQKIDFNFDWNFSLTDSQKYILPLLIKVIQSLYNYLMIGM